MPSALRRNERTMIIRVKLVIIISRDGTTARNRNRNMISSISMGFPLPELPSSVREISDAYAICPHAADTLINAARQRSPLAIFLFPFIISLSRFSSVFRPAAVRLF